MEPCGLHSGDSWFNYSNEASGRRSDVVAAICLDFYNGLGGLGGEMSTVLPGSMSTANRYSRVRAQKYHWHKQGSLASEPYVRPDVIASHQGSEFGF